ncbi:unnamed protein product [Lactuca saligna]|uniref:CASP-like protein n=1 Tax=Lactuca saligna TaxID=75948 RepID=A0AA35Z2S2_LACSI|nr:unnamed protein product [Lactuca saligna]
MYKSRICHTCIHPQYLLRKNKLCFAVFCIPETMVSNGSTIPQHAHAAISMEVPLKTSASPPEYIATRLACGSKKHAVINLFSRVVILASAVGGIILLITSKQTKLITIAPGLAISKVAKFSHSDAHRYLLAALCTAALYSIITGLISVLALMKPGGISSKLKFQFVILDSLLLGIMAAATGASGGVSYVGYKGNSHSRWNKICNMYNSYCMHVGTSIFLSFISSITFLFLVWINVYALSKKIARR